MSALPSHSESLRELYKQADVLWEEMRVNNDVYHRWREASAVTGPIVVGGGPGGDRALAIRSELQAVEDRIAAVGEQDFEAALVLGGHGEGGRRGARQARLLRTEQRHLGARRRVPLLLLVPVGRRHRRRDARRRRGLHGLLLQRSRGLRRGLDRRSAHRPRLAPHGPRPGRGLLNVHEDHLPLCRARLAALLVPGLLPPPRRAVPLLLEAKGAMTPPRQSWPRRDRVASFVLRFLPTRATLIYVRLRFGVTICTDPLPEHIRLRAQALAKEHGW